MKIICPKCGIIHDEDFAPCKSTLSLPAAEAAPRHVTEERALAVAAGAGLTSLAQAQQARTPTGLAATAPAATERSTLEPPANTNQPEPEWRREVAERLESYRARRRKHRPLDVRGNVPGDSQPFLALQPENREASRSKSAFPDRGNGDGYDQLGSDGNGHSNGNGHASSHQAGNGHANETVRSFPVVEFAETEPGEDAGEYTRRRAALRIAARPRRQDRFEITVAQPQFDFSVNDTQELHPRDEERPVADLRERRLAGIVDAAILGVTCAGFFLLFKALGGEFSFSRFGIASCLASVYLVYAQYFVLFTVFTGVTPGMMLRGLEVLTLDGHAPATRHLLWRSFGYLISAAAVFLGFLWAWWDDDHLTWQDRISQTYVTPATEAASAELTASPQES